MVAELAEWSRPPLCAMREGEKEKKKRREIRENTPRITLLGPAGRPGQTGVGHYEVRSIPRRRATSQGNHFSWPYEYVDRP